MLDIPAGSYQTAPNNSTTHQQQLPWQSGTTKLSFPYPTDPLFNLQLVLVTGSQCWLRLSENFKKEIRQNTPTVPVRLSLVQIHFDTTSQCEEKAQGVWEI